MINLLFVIIFFLAVTNALSQSEVKFGNQVWMTKNLDVDRFRNGDLIPEVKNAKQWEKAAKNKKAVFCFYEYDSKNGKVYGKLYNWYAVNDPRGLAPNGYHIPSDAEWTVLTDFLEGEFEAGEKLKSTNGWSNGGNGDNSSGFNGLPGGSCYYNGNFYFITVYGYFWSSSESRTDSAWSRGLYYNTTGVHRHPTDKGAGLSVRCIKD